MLYVLCQIEKCTYQTTIERAIGNDNQSIEGADLVLIEHNMHVNRLDHMRSRSHYPPTGTCRSTHIP